MTKEEETLRLIAAYLDGVVVGNDIIIKDPEKAKDIWTKDEIEALKGERSLALNIINRFRLYEYADE